MTDSATPTEPATTSPSGPATTDRLDTFLAAAGATVGFGFGVGLAAAAVLAVGVLVASGAANDILDQDQYQDRVEAIGAVYRQGVNTRQELERSGTVLTTEAMCEDAFRRIGADRERGEVEKARRTADGKPDLAFRELRRLSFINGCLGRPNNLPATPLPSPSPSPS